MAVWRRTCRRRGHRPRNHPSPSRRAHHRHLRKCRCGNRRARAGKFRWILPRKRRTTCRPRRRHRTRLKSWDKLRARTKRSAGNRAASHGVDTCNTRSWENRGISDRDRNESLRQLVALAEDGVRAFESAVVEIENRKLKGLFRELAISRKFTAVDLRKTLRASGGGASESGTVKGSALRLYAQIKTAIADSNETAVLGELERSERRALEAFEAAAAREQSGELHDAIRMHAQEISRTLESLSALRMDFARPPNSRDDANNGGRGNEGS
jgi:uncharacterized protein (TIGR02284 family)